MAHTLDADRLRRHQRHNHISLLETASTAGGGDGGGTTTDDDEDAVSLAYLSQHSPSDVDSSSNYYPPTTEFYDSDERPTTRLTHSNSSHHTNSNSHTARAQHARRSSLSSLRYSGAQQHGATGYELLFTRAYLGLVANFAAVGAVHGVFQSVAYPFFKIYLNMDEYEALSAEKWLALPWLTKFLLAFASDAIGSTTSKKKLVLYVGWTWCLLCALIVILAPSPAPYARDRVVVNENAPAAGGKFVALLTLAAYGYVFVDAVSDGLMVQLAHLAPLTSAPAPAHKNELNDEELHEPEPQQQQPQQQSNAHMLAVVTTLQATKFGGEMVTTFLVALLCNSDAYGGSFAWSPALRGVFVLVLVLGIAALACTRFFLDIHDSNNLTMLQDQHELSQVEEDEHDEELQEDLSMVDRIKATTKSLWSFIGTKSVYQVVLFAFVTRVGFAYYASSAKALFVYWLDVSPLMCGVFSSIHFGVYALVGLAFHKWHLLKLLSFKRVIVGATAGAIFTTLLSTLFTVFNVLRSALLTLAFEQLTSAFEALAYFVVLFAAVQVSTGGGGGRLASSQYNLVLAVGNLGVPFAASLSQSVGAHLDVFDSEYASDTHHARAQVMYCFIITCVVKLVCLAALPLLAQQTSNDLRARTQTTRTSDLSKQEQKQQAQAQLASSKSSKWSAIAVAGGVGLLLFWATLMALLASFETTACLTVAGGEGC